MEQIKQKWVSAPTMGEARLKSAPEHGKATFRLTLKGVLTQQVKGWLSGTVMFTQMNIAFNYLCGLFQLPTIHSLVAGKRVCKCA